MKLFEPYYRTISEIVPTVSFAVVMAASPPSSARSTASKSGSFCYPSLNLGTLNQHWWQSNDVVSTAGLIDKGEPLSDHANSLDWISLSREAIPEMEPLTSEERTSFNDFFWSHF